jgi:hypothetical protein
VWSFKAGVWGGGKALSTFALPHSPSDNHGAHSTPRQDTQHDDPARLAFTARRQSVRAQRTTSASQPRRSGQSPLRVNSRE